MLDVLETTRLKSLFIATIAIYNIIFTYWKMHV